MSYHYKSVHLGLANEFPDPQESELESETIPKKEAEE